MERFITNNNYYFGSIGGIKSLDSPDIVHDFCLSLIIELCNHYSNTSSNHKIPIVKKSQKIIVHNAQDSSRHISFSVHVCVLIMVSLIFVLRSFWSWSFLSNSIFDDLRKI